MAKVTITGVDDNGKFKTEIKRTPVLITELIHDFPKMCEADIHKALCEIRESSERDEQTIRNFAHSLKEKNNETKGVGMPKDCTSGERQ